MRVLLETAVVAVAASLLFGVVWALVGSRLGGGPEERERTLREGPGAEPRAPGSDPPSGREDPPAA
ncbi:hypothetical protein [Peterkaempfera bronchialis]|uniref:Uncharacterized protein n=1 Tax=Peterkaempfera bronchialis TaxID=2126346 RepID=A0A345SZY2_9ACTN|nr:hypothetical protein [Peterkaempfera bronchialis]AXI79287.1 hypothetical protein C7M71_019575 [Peterkaempfera bronchialis]